VNSYIIDHYHSLPDNVLFIHPNRYQWHNDDPDYDGVPMLRHFQLPYLEKQGYVNIRCAWSLGCPNEIKPLEEEGEHREAVHAGGDYKNAFQHLFPEKAVPRAVGVSCCAQFAATREKIRERKRSEYERYRDWIIATNLSDNISGRVMEYSWHSMSPPLVCEAPLRLCLPPSSAQVLILASNLWKRAGSLSNRCRMLLQSLWSLQALMQRPR
jgi:hypothetical protein